MKHYNLIGYQKNENNENDIIKIENKKQEIDKLISNLYEDKITGIISQDTFSNLINKYEKQKQQLEIKIKRYEIKKIDDTKITQNKDFIKEILELNELNDENISLVFKLINKIIIDDKNININYRFDISA